MTDLQTCPYIDSRELTLHNLIRQKLSKYLREQSVSVITPTNKPMYLQNIFENYSSQSIKNKELIIILNNNRLDLTQWRQYASKYSHVRVYQLDEANTLGECLNYAVEHSSGEYIAKFDDDDYYAPNYLSDMICCFSFTEAAVVGKVSHFIYFQKTNQLVITNKGSGFSYINFLSGGTHLISRDVFNKVKFEERNLGEDFCFNHQCNLAKIRLYASGPFNYVRIRSGNPNDHTWKIEDEEYLAGCEPVCQTEDFKPWVTV